MPQEWQKNRDEDNARKVPFRRKGPLIVDPAKVAQKHQAPQSVDNEALNESMNLAHSSLTNQGETVPTAVGLQKSAQIVDLANKPIHHAMSTSQRTPAISKGPKMGIFHPKKKHGNQHHNWQHGQAVNAGQFVHNFPQHACGSNGPKAGLFYPPKYRQSQSVSQRMTNETGVNSAYGSHRDFASKYQQSGGAISSSWSAPVSQQRLHSSFNADSQEPTRAASGECNPFEHQISQMNHINRYDTHRHASYVTNLYSDDPPVNSPLLGMDGPGPSVVTSRRSSIEIASSQFRLPPSVATSGLADDQAQLPYDIHSAHTTGLGIQGVDSGASFGQMSLDPALDINNPGEDAFGSRKSGTFKKGYSRGKPKNPKTYGAYHHPYNASVLVKDPTHGLMNSSRNEANYQSHFPPLFVSGQNARGPTPILQSSSIEPGKQTNHGSIQLNETSKDKKKASKNKNKKKYHHHEVAAEMKNEAEAQHLKQKEARNERAARRESLKSEQQHQ